MAAMARQQAAFMADFEDEEEASDAVETPAVRRVPSFPCIFAIRSRCFRCTPLTHRVRRVRGQAEYVEPLPDCIICRDVDATKHMGFMGYAEPSSVRYFCKGNPGHSSRVNGGWDDLGEGAVPMVLRSRECAPVRTNWSSGVFWSCP